MKRYHNEIKINEEKICSWYRDTVSQKIDFTAYCHLRDHPQAAELIIFYSCATFSRIHFWNFLEFNMRTRQPFIDYRMGVMFKIVLSLKIVFPFLALQVQMKKFRPLLKIRVIFILNFGNFFEFSFCWNNNLSFEKSIWP